MFLLLFVCTSVVILNIYTRFVVHLLFKRWIYISFYAVCSSTVFSIAFGHNHLTIMSLVQPQPKTATAAIFILLICMSFNITYYIQTSLAPNVKVMNDCKIVICWIFSECLLYIVSSSHVVYLIFIFITLILRGNLLAAFHFFCQNYSFSLQWHSHLLCNPLQW